MSSPPPPTDDPSGRDDVKHCELLCVSNRNLHCTHLFDPSPPSIFFFFFSKRWNEDIQGEAST